MLLLAAAHAAGSAAPTGNRSHEVGVDGKAIPSKVDLSFCYANRYPDLQRLVREKRWSVHQLKCAAQPSHGRASLAASALAPPAGTTGSCTASARAETRGAR